MRRPAKAFLYLIYLVVVGGLLTAIILDFTNSKAPQPVATAPPAPTQAPAAPKPTEAPAVPAQPQSSSSSQAGQAATASGSSASSDLTNTGPGNILAVFIGATVVGTVVYRKALTVILK